MEFMDVVKNRRTTRQFTSQPVEKEQIRRIIQAGIQAPSFDHKRKWNFVVITNPAAKEKALASIEALPCAFEEPKDPLQEMIKIAFPRQKSMFQEAPVLVLPVFRRVSAIQKENMSRATMDVAEIWCVIENMFLAATNEGLSCAMRIPWKDQPKKVLAAAGCPEGSQLLCMIGIGHPAPDAEYPTQTYPDLEQCIHWEKW